MKLAEKCSDGLNHLHVLVYHVYCFFGFCNEVINNFVAHLPVHHRQPEEHNSKYSKILGCHKNIAALRKIRAKKRRTYV